MIINVIKLAVGSAASVGSGVFVNEALKQFTPENLSKTKKVCSVIGGVMLGGIVGRASSNYAEEMVDEGVTVVSKLKEKLSRNK